MEQTTTVSAAAQARNEYYRAYRAKHKDKVREYNRRYWEKKAAALTAEQSGESDDGKKD